jgi:hypothetical protein
MMNWIEELAIIPAMGVALTGGLLILFDNRRLLILALAVQYLFAGWMAALALPIQVAATKVVAGLMACAILTLTWTALGWRVQEKTTQAIPSGRAFRVIAVLLVFAAAGGIGRSNWMMLPGITSLAMLGSTLSISFGLLQLGLSEEPTRISVGLLTLLAGFEVAYSAIEPALAVIALLAAVHLGIALVVGYILLLEKGLDEKKEEGV